MKRITPLAAVIVLVSGCATMQDLNPFASELGGLDTDGDGVISQREAEASQALSQNFALIDTNSSGGIDSKEYKAASTRLSEVNFEEADVNGDGVISKREAGALPMSLDQAFGAVDIDGDGNVSKTEYNASRVNILGQVPFQTVDSDNDGVLDKKEAKDNPALSESFDRLDVNEDGLVNQQEFRSAQR